MNINQDNINHELIIKIELCNSWSLDNDTAYINKVLISELQKKNLNVKAEYVRSDSNQFSINLLKNDGQKVILYSDKNSQHEMNPKYTHSITHDLAIQIVKKILKE